MPALRLLLVAALLALPFWVRAAAPAQACSVASAPTLDDQVAYADLIAVGTIEEILILPPESVAHPEMLEDGAQPVEMKLDATEFLKGSASDPVLVFSPAFTTTEENGRLNAIFSSSTSCGSRYLLGTTYVMFMTRNDSLRYTPTGLYGGTTTVSDAQQTADYIVQIRAAVARQMGLPPTGSGPSHNGPPIVPLAAASALAAAGLAANAGLVLRRR